LAIMASNILRVVIFVLLVNLFCCSSGLYGRSNSVGGITVADLTPFSGDAHQMATQKLCPDSCSGHGLCIADPTSPFPPSCTCFYMWYTKNCSKAECPSNCSNSGTCNPSNGVCSCNKGLGGADCSIKLNVNQCVHNCSNHGICDKGVCKCFKNWNGIDCSVELCKRNCSFHGVCVKYGSTNPYQCACEEGFRGRDCSIIVKACPGSPACSGNGKCNKSTGNCTCATGFHGKDCSQVGCLNGYLGDSSRRPPPYSSPDCPNDCSCHGYCSCADYSNGQGGNCRCSCEPGWAGEACTTNTKGSLFLDIIQPSPDMEVYPQFNPLVTPEQIAALAKAGKIKDGV